MPAPRERLILTGQREASLLLVRRQDQHDARSCGLPGVHIGAVGVGLRPPPLSLVFSVRSQQDAVSNFASPH